MSAAPALIDALRRRAGEHLACAGETTPWCFGRRAGERHSLALTCSSRAAATRLTEKLDDYDFALPTHLVADVFTSSREEAGRVRVVVEALTFALD